MDYDENAYRRIGDDGPHEERLIAGLLERLVKLREQSHPKHGAESEAGKDMRAFQALNAAQDLVDALAGWAVDHQIGLALKGLSFVPLGHPGSRGLPEYTSARQAVDSHEHERQGANLWRKDVEPDIARRIAANLLAGNGGAMHGSTARQLETALRALDLGFAAPPIIQAEGEGRKITYNEQRQHMRAIGHWKFREFTGVMPRKTSQVAVAEAYGVSAFTLGTWQSRLQAEVGPLEMANVYAFAEGHASYVRAEPDLVQRAHMIKHHHWYGDDMLAKDAATYQGARVE